METINVRAPNPGLFTGSGTNSWILVSDRQSVVIHAGPDLEIHESALMEALDETEPVAVLITHPHPDHCLLANRLAGTLGVPAMAACPGPGFKPDRTLVDAEEVGFGTEAIEVIETPGHTSHHLCFRVGNALFSGDHIIGGSSVIVEHMTEYLESLGKLQGMGIEMIYPGHGDPMGDPESVIAGHIEHREEREAQIMSAVRAGAGMIGSIVERVYADVDPVFFHMAARSVGAHLRKLAEEERVELPLGSSGWSSPVRLPTAPVKGAGT